MPRETTRQAQVVWQQTERLAERVRAAIAAPDLERDELRALLQDLAVGIEQLRIADEELTVMTKQLAESHLQIEVERERYVRLFEFAPDAYVVTDTDGRVVEANGQAEQLLGVPRQFLMGRFISSFVELPFRRKVRTILADLGEGGRSTPFEVRVEPRGAEQPVVAEIQAGSNYSPLVGGYLVRWLLRDVSERHQLERRLQQLHADVEVLNALSAVNRLATSDDDPTESLLDDLVRLAAGDGMHAGIFITDDRGGVAARAVSDEVADELCRLQIEHGGPAIKALESDEPELRERRELAPWPGLLAAMERHGVEWTLTHPLRLTHGTGVFNVYGAGTSTRAERTTGLLVEHASSVIDNHELFASTRDLASHLEVALESRGVIEQAKGVVMAREGCGPDEAFEVLRRRSQHENRKLRTIAEDLVAGVARGHDGSPPAG